MRTTTQQRMGHVVVEFAREFDRKNFFFFYEVWFRCCDQDERWELREISMKKVSEKEKEKERKNDKEERDG